MTAPGWRFIQGAAASGEEKNNTLLQNAPCEPTRSEPHWVLIPGVHPGATMERTVRAGFRLCTPSAVTVKRTFPSVPRQTDSTSEDWTTTSRRTRVSLQHQA